MKQLIFHNNRRIPPEGMILSILKMILIILMKGQGIHILPAITRHPGEVFLNNCRKPKKITRKMTVDKSLMIPSTHKLSVLMEDELIIENLPLRARMNPPSKVLAKEQFPSLKGID